MTIGGRRQAGVSAKQYFNSRDRRGGDRKNEPWYTNLRLRLGDRPLKIHFQRPEKAYQDPTSPENSYYWKVGEQYFVKTKAFPRGKTFDVNLEEDLISAYMNPTKFGLKHTDVSEGKWLKDFSPKMYYCVSGWVEEWFHVVENSREYGGEMKSWHERVLCEGRNCKNCRNKVEKVFGQRFWFDFSYMQWFYTIDAEYEKLERLTKDGGYAWITHYVCQHCNNTFRFDYVDRNDSKESREILMDVTQKCANCDSDDISLVYDDDKKQWGHMAECQNCNETWTLLTHDDKILRYASTAELQCLSCKKKSIPEPVYQHSNGLSEWKSYDIYDVQFTMSKNHENRLVISDVCIQEPDERLFDTKYQGDDPDMAAKVVENHKKCLDLDRVHPVTSADRQAEILGLPNLFDQAIQQRPGPRISKPSNDRLPPPKAEEPEEKEEAEAEEEPEERPVMVRPTAKKILIARR